ncbi:hypothetical protein GQ55_1G313900 [Panicum hallii var. hallii]|uniref:KIB1-4 beta-propeller domain-containing protein n=1 Tax=Panicum hallii var. hallii TaxID=1504633 RepID=A0A2T7F9H4_9POAL|nr:hypothetical protein GQ55_1G313900 [Panicum hallii var. hallii]
MAKQRRQAGCDVRRLMHGPDRDPERYKHSGSTTMSSALGHLPAMRARSRRRDWTKLPPDIAAEIAGRLLGVDMTEYIRFRSVCKPWRQSTEDPRSLHSRFIPHNWVVLVNYLDCFRCNYGEDARKFRLLNVATGASLTHVEFPELSGHHAMGYAEGLLVLWNKATSGIRLLNPLTHAVTDLPDFSSVVAEASPAALDGAYHFRGFGVIDGGPGAAGASPPTIVFFLDGEVPMIACIRLGEPRWALVNTSELDGGTGHISFSSTLSLRGRFYMATSTGDVLTVELDPEPRLVYVIRQTTAATKPTTTTAPRATRPFFEFFLSPSSNDHAGMIMVRASRDRGQVEVFQVDVDAGKLVPTSTVGADRAVFIGSTRALSISTRLFPSIAANAVYFCIGSISMDLLFYIVHLDNGWGEPARLPYSDQGQAVGPFVVPCNLDVYLACCIDVVQVLTM